MERKIPISGNSKLLALIGHPVSHSLSPLMHNASFAHLQIDAVYLALDATLETLPLVAPALKKMGVVGYNVTMPCKQAVLDYMDDISDAARLIGAVNTVSIRDGKSYGDNTDGKGFWRNCRDYGFDVENKNVAVLGAGGAGSAIFVEAALQGASKVVVLNRPGCNFEAIQARAALVSQESGVPVVVQDLDDSALLKSACEQCDIVVNCTKVGMAPELDSSLVPSEYMHLGMTVADVVYNPRETKMIKDAAALGLTTIPGLGMLLHQGAIAEELWFPDAKMNLVMIKELLDF